MAEKNCKLCFHYDVCYAVGRMPERAETCSKYATDVVEVVRCKDCIHRRVPARCSLWMGTLGDNDYFREHGEDFFCAFGERTLKERGGEK